jgi:hypothetical protein
MLSLGLGLAAVAQAARVAADVPPPQKRQVAVALAEKLAQRVTPEPLPSRLASPFNPSDFDQPEPGEVVATAVVGPPAPPPPPRDREILEAVAVQLNPTGTIQLGDAPRLVMGSKNFEVGTRFTVTYNNQDYELELVAIDRTTFKLRYRGEETIRPIKSVR